MPKTFPIIIDVEEIALGTVLRKLNDMAGIAKLHLDLGRGGESGQQAIATEAVPYRQRGPTREAATLKLLTDGPRHHREIQKRLGGKTTVYAVLHTLRKKGLVEAGNGIGMHQLTAKGHALVNGTAALPASTASTIKRTAGGRTPKGVSERLLLTLIAGSDTPMLPTALAQELQPQGFSKRAVEGMLRRARVKGTLHNTGRGYELTAKGLKEARASSGLNGTGAASHG